MPRTSVDRETRRAILDARQMIEEAEKEDCNEAETRRRIERIFENVMGYDALKNLSRERAVRGAGETEYVDFTIQLEPGEDTKPLVMVEIKRVCIDLAPKHLKQVASYAINAGCEWILLTNSKEWRLYHVSFGKPPVTKMVYSWNILTDDIPTLAKRFGLISIKQIKKGTLEAIWQKTNVLKPHNLLQAMLSEGCMNNLRRTIQWESGIRLTPEDIVAGIRRLLNESALTEFENIRLSLPNPPKPKHHKKTPSKKKTDEEKVEAAPSEKVESSTITADDINKEQNLHREP